MKKESVIPRAPKQERHIQRARFPKDEKIYGDPVIDAIEMSGGPKNNGTYWNDIGSFFESDEV